MKIKYEQHRAFVSSRMEELRAERKTVKDALDEMRLLAWVYEDDAGAQPHSPEESYREELKQSEVSDDRSLNELRRIHFIQSCSGRQAGTQSAVGAASICKTPFASEGASRFS